MISKHNFYQVFLAAINLIKKILSHENTLIIVCVCMCDCIAATDQFK